MRIGIDIDDTITNTWECFIPAYSSEFNIPIETLKKKKPYYESVKDLLSLEEYFKRIEYIYKEYTPKVKANKEASKYINELYNLGHIIYFITARGYGYDKEYCDLTYKVTEKFLKDNNIKYHKLIIGASNKGEICQKEKIDLLIDDSIKHCTYATELGIEALLYEQYYNKHDKTLKHAKNWIDVYNNIKDR